VFVCSRSDLFHEDTPEDFLDSTFGLMQTQRRHTFLLLTKRPERMRDYVAAQVAQNERAAGFWSAFEGKDLRPSWPFPNVWLGVSIEDQATADERIPLLLDTPAAHRWVSAEPLLWPIRFPVPTIFWSLLDWIVIGGESGPNHRPCDPAWIADLAHEAKTTYTKCYVKQASAYRPGQQGDIPDALWAVKETPWATHA
jgi:protein gp37